MTPDLKHLKLAPVVAAIGSRLPQIPPALCLATMLNIARGRVLPIEDLESLVGRRLTVRVTDLGLTLRLRYCASGFRACLDRSPADLTMSASSRDFLDLVLGEKDADTLFFDRRLLFEGDTDLGLLVKNSLDGIDWAEFSEHFAWLPLHGRLARPLRRGAIGY